MNSFQRLIEGVQRLCIVLIYNWNDNEKKKQQNVHTAGTNWTRINKMQK